MRYKCWRARDNLTHVIVVDGAFDEIPDRIKGLGPWVGSKDGEVERLKPHYRKLLADQGFVVVHQHVSKFAPEADR